MTRFKRSRLALAGGALVTALGLSACAPASSLPPGVSPEPMPNGAEWQGVYQGPYHIYLRITRQGDHAVGTWRSMGGRAGELWGNLDGNVMKFTWTEHDLNNKGSWSGRGYFVFNAKQGDRPEIRGEWGLGLRDSDGSWYATKRTDVPDDAPLDAAEQKLTDAESSSSGGTDDAGGSGCMGAACVGDDRELSEDQN